MHQYHHSVVYTIDSKHCQQLAQNADCTNIRSKEQQREPEVGLRIHESLPELVPLPFLRFGTHIVVAKAFDGFHSVFALKELRSSWGIREEEPEIIQADLSLATGRHGFLEKATYQMNGVIASVMQPQKRKML